MKIGKKLNAKLEHHMARSRALLYEVFTHIYIYIYIYVTVGMLKDMKKREMCGVSSSN